jgi:NADPH2:quinone reductase
MTCWQVTAPGEPLDVMTLAEVPVPVPGPGEVLVEVWSAALNFPDVLLARGTYQERPEPPFTPGVELVGMVVAAGQGVERSRIGERVIGVPRLPHGALATYAIVPESDLHAAPAGLDDAAASAFHIAYQTGWFGLYRRAALRVGETLLVNAAAGGVGSAAVQLGRAAGARVIGVVGSAAKVEPARAQGADLVIDRSGSDVVEQVMAYTRGRGVDVVFDPVGGAAYRTATKVIAFEGRLVVVGFAGGEITEASLGHPLVKNYSVLGLHWGAYRARDRGLVRRAHTELTDLVEVGVLRPLIGDRLAFEDAAQGLARLAKGGTIGRLTVRAPS